jgi:hypothetical protein
MTSQRTVRINSRILSASTLFIAVLTLLLALASTAIAQNPVPFVNQPLVPDATAPGGTGFTLTVNGTGFVATSVVNWNGSPRTTTFVRSSQLTATILDSDITTASTASVTVVSPAPGGGVSNTVFFPINTPSTSIAFSTTDYTTGSYPLFAATADFRGDGNLDLAVANDSGSVSVMLGNGNGTFQTQVEYAAGSVPQTPIVGDYNRDGKLDLAVPARGNSVVGILLGNGNGTFQPAVSYPGGCFETYGITADFNGDGNLDVLTVNQCGTVSILLGNGDGTFQDPVNYAVGVNATGAATGDFNGDGKLDLAVSNWSADTVSILLGNGDGTFQSAVDYPAGDDPGGVNIADINGDGILDLLVPNQGSSSVSVLLGKGDGTFAAQVEYPVAAGAVRAEVGDFNQDGKLDLAVVTYKPSLDILLGNGDGTFQPALSFPTANDPWNVVVADFNQDGRLDAAVSGFGIDAIAVMLQTSSVQTTPTTTTLVSSLNPSTYGQTVTFTASVTSTAGTPTGTVIFYDGSTSIGTATLANGSASIPVSSLMAGSQSITAAYQGSTSFSPSTSAPLSQIVNIATTATSITSSLNPAGTNQSVTFTATVTSQYGGAATGSVTFLSGSQTLGTATLSGNRATLTTSFAAAGTYSISAKYNGDGNNSTSTSSVLSQLINTSTTTTLTSSPNPSIVGEAVTFTATVTSTAGSPPNGESVTFYNGSAILGTAPLTSGIASLTTSSLAAGIYTITATYPGDANFAPSTSPGLRQVVNSTTKSATSTTLTSSLNPSIYGQSVTWTATVTTSGSVPPTGNVNFTWGYSIGVVAINANGVATLTLSKLNADSYPLTAVYFGDANNLGSTSPVLNQLITAATTSSTLISSPDPSTEGQSVTFTDTISSNTVTPTGPVTFTAGKTVLATVQLSNGIAKFITSTLAVGTTHVVATYDGDSNVTGSSTSRNQTVEK